MYNTWLGKTFSDFPYVLRRSWTKNSPKIINFFTKKKKTQKINKLRQLPESPVFSTLDETLKLFFSKIRFLKKKL